jgi:hypothetical protein
MLSVCPDGVFDDAAKCTIRQFVSYTVPGSLVSCKRNPKEEPANKSE